MALNNDDISINSIIGAGTVIRGDIKVNGFVRIDGDIDGNLETSGNLIIGEKARIQGNIIARSITVGGIIKGNITATVSVKLLSSSVVLGNIQTHNFQADENVIFNGHCIALSSETEYEQANLKWQNYLAITSHSILQPSNELIERSFLNSKFTDTEAEKDDAIVEETVENITLQSDGNSNDNKVEN